MNRRRSFFTISAILGTVLLLFSGKSIIFDRQKNSFSVLQVDATPQSAVLLNDQNVGNTPYLNEKLKSGEYKIKVSDWETKLTLIPDTLTYISRNSGPTEEQSSGQTLILEKLASERASEMVIVSIPGQAFVRLDGLDKGKTSLVVDNPANRDHMVVVSIPGYSSEIIRARTISGFRLNIIVKLAKITAEPKPTIGLLDSTPSAQLLVKPYVVIKPTPTGFLRVRMQPSTDSTESGQVKPAEKYPLLSETDGWVEIKLPNITGWVSDQYVEKIK